MRPARVREKKDVERGGGGGKRVMGLRELGVALEWRWCYLFEDGVRGVIMGYRWEAW